MIAFLKLWPMFTLLLSGSCDCTPTIMITETSTYSSDIENINEQSLLRKVIAGVYNHNFANFKKVINIKESAYFLKADVLLELYAVMREVEHTDNPYKALYLYKEIEEKINNVKTNDRDRHKLEGIRQELLLNVIVPKGSQIIEDAIYMNEFIHKQSGVRELLSLLSVNQTMLTLTLKHMTKKVHSMPIRELLPIFSNLSAPVNVVALLSLYDVNQMQTSERYEIVLQLIDLKQNINVPNLLERKIDALEFINLFSTTICFYKQNTNGNRYYVYASSELYVHLGHFYSTQGEFVIFKTAFKQQPLSFSFRHIKHGGALYLNSETNKVLLSRKYDEPLNIDWKVAFKDGQVLLQNMKNFLCATPTDKKLYIGNRSHILSHVNECKWFVEDCSYLI